MNVPVQAVQRHRLARRPIPRVPGEDRPAHPPQAGGGEERPRGPLRADREGLRAWAGARWCCWSPRRSRPWSRSAAGPSRSSSSSIWRTSTPSSGTRPTTWARATTGAAKSYELLRRAMEETGKVGIGRFVMRNKEYLVTVRPLGTGLVLETMHFPDEIRDQKEVHRAACPGQRVPAQGAGAGQAADRGAERQVGPQASSRTAYRDRVAALIQKKAKGQKIVVEEAARGRGQGRRSDGGAEGQSEGRRCRGQWAGDGPQRRQQRAAEVGPPTLAPLASGLNRCAFRRAPPGRAGRFAARHRQSLSKMRAQAPY